MRQRHVTTSVAIYADRAECEIELRRIPANPDLPALPACDVLNVADTRIYLDRGQTIQLRDTLNAFIAANPEEEAA